MSRTRKAQPDADTRMIRKLLEALSETGARATLSDLDNDALVVFAPKNGVTLARARFSLKAADAAVGAGLAEWRREGKTRVLSLTEAGRAHLRRLETNDNSLDPFRAQHGAFERRAPRKGAPPIIVNDAESPLAWLARRKGADGRPFLAPAQVEAGERFRRDIDQAQLLQRVTANWDASAAAARASGERGLAVSDIALDARGRLSRAGDAVGPDLYGLLTDVCGYLKGLETIESERGWPARSGKVVLKIALERLARHYGLGDEATGPTRAPTRHWAPRTIAPRCNQKACGAHAASASRASLLIRSTMERSPLARCGVRCSARPSCLNSGAASVSTISAARRPE